MVAILPCPIHMYTTQKPIRAMKLLFQRLVRRLLTWPLNARSRQRYKTAHWPNLATHISMSTGFPECFSECRDHSSESIQAMTIIQPRFADELRRPRWSPQSVRTHWWRQINTRNVKSSQQTIADEPEQCYSIFNIRYSTFDIRCATFRWSRLLNPICEFCHTPTQDVAPDMSCLLSTSITTDDFTKLPCPGTIDCTDRYVSSISELVSQSVLLVESMFEEKASSQNIWVVNPYTILFRSKLSQWLYVTYHRGILLHWRLLQYESSILLRCHPGGEDIRSNARTCGAVSVDDRREQIYPSGMLLLLASSSQVCQLRENSWMTMLHRLRSLQTTLLLWKYNVRGRLPSMTAWIRDISAASQDGWVITTVQNQSQFP